MRKFNISDKVTSIVIFQLLVIFVMITSNTDSNTARWNDGH